MCFSVTNAMCLTFIPFEGNEPSNCKFHCSVCKSEIILYSNEKFWFTTCNYSINVCNNVFIFIKTKHWCIVRPDQHMNVR